MKPIPFPTELTSRTGSLESRETVRRVEGKAADAPDVMTLEHYLGGLRRILNRATANGGRLHPQEVLKAKDCLDGVERMLDLKHAEGLRGGNHE